MPSTEIEIAAEKATAFLKALANQNRLQILCLLIEKEQTVSELERALDITQPKLSQQLARLRTEGLVSARRDSKMVYYSLASEEAQLVLELLHRLFCPQREPDMQNLLARLRTDPAVLATTD